MPSLKEKFPKSFVGAPNQKFLCPTCCEGLMVPDATTFFEVEPAFSKNAHSHEAWDPDWIKTRFTYRAVCNNGDCSEVAFVSGRGGAEQGYIDQGEIGYYDYCRIETIFPAPNLIPIPEEAPYEIKTLLKKCFALYWVDTSAAANAMRASLEALMDEMKIPSSQPTKAGKVVTLNLHSRIELWSATHQDYADLCLALKEVGNLGSHGETVSDKHFFGALEIYSHVLQQLFENSAAKMKGLAEEIRAELKSKRSRST